MAWWGFGLADSVTMERFVSNCCSKRWNATQWKYVCSPHVDFINWMVANMILAAEPRFFRKNKKSTATPLIVPAPPGIEPNTN